MNKPLIEQVERTLSVVEMLKKLSSLRQMGFYECATNVRGMTNIAYIEEYAEQLKEYTTAITDLLTKTDDPLVVENVVTAFNAFEVSGESFKVEDPDDEFVFSPYQILDPDRIKKLLETLVRLRSTWDRFPDQVCVDFDKAKTLNLVENCLWTITSVVIALSDEAQGEQKTPETYGIFFSVKRLEKRKYLSSEETEEEQKKIEAEETAKHNAELAEAARAKAAESCKDIEKIAPFLTSDEIARGLQDIENPEYVASGIKLLMSQMEDFKNVVAQISNQEPTDVRSTPYMEFFSDGEVTADQLLTTIKFLEGVTQHKLELRNDERMIVVESDTQALPAGTSLSLW